MIPESHLIPLPGPPGRYWSIHLQPDGTHKVRGGPQLYEYIVLCDTLDEARLLIRRLIDAGI